MRKVILCLAMMVTTTIMAQDLQIIRGDCLPDPVSEPGRPGLVAGTRAKLPSRITTWDKNKTYHQLVILFSFDDTDFQEEHTREYYNKILNEPGFNEGNGPGCVADYYRVQSGGLLNLQFDVYGPYKVSQKAQPYEKPTSATRNYGRESMIEATEQLLAEHPEIDFSQYDWTGDGSVNQVIYVYAGYAGNQSGAYGHIWPNTSSFSTLTTHDVKEISNYTASGELFVKDKRPCGIGTICHEFTHSLGLPDIYPTGGNIYSALDEWDLMDGGNFTNWGWCPPNFTPLEKMLLGWLTPVELTEPTTITNLKPVTEGGNVYLIRHTANEYLLLENRQWTGWDCCSPGKGLVVYAVNYNAAKWSANTANAYNDEKQFGFRLVHADNLDYESWRALGTLRKKQYVDQTNRLNNTWLSTSAYPWSTDSTEFINRSVTNVSTPNAKMINRNGNNSRLLSKPVTNIAMAADGTVSFTFLGVKSVGDGDANADSQVTITDAVGVVDYILGNPDANFDPKAADVNGDNVVNITDAVGIVDIILEK